MGTRSIIGIKAEGGWMGRYCHWDGYPEGVGAGVWHLVKRDGLETAVKTLVQDNYSWSCITLQDEHDPEEVRDEKDFIKGYGYVHSGGRNVDMIVSNGDKWGTEWAYILSPEGMEVLKVDYDSTTTPMGFYRWDAEGEPPFVEEARRRFGEVA